MEFRCRSVVCSFLCLLIVLLSQAVAVASPVAMDIDKSTSNVSLGLHLSYFEDASKKFILEDVVSGQHSWISVTDNVPNFGFNNSIFWFRVVLHNAADEHIEKLLEIPYSLLDEVRGYQLLDGLVTKEHVMGHSVPFGSRPIEHRNLIFPVHLPANKSVTVYFRVRGESTVLFPLTLWEERDFWQNEQLLLLCQALFFGLMGVMIIYNALIAWGTKDKVYLLYVCLISMTTMFQAIYRGFAFQFIWPNFPSLNAQIMAVIIPLACMLAGLFSIEILKLKKSFRGAYFAIRVFIILSLVHILLALIFPYTLIIQSSVLLQFVQAFFIFYVCIVHWRSAESEARVFFIAWIVFLSGCIIMPLMSFGIIPYVQFIDSLFQIGSAIEVILLSLILVLRVNRLRREHASSQLESQEIKLKACVEMEEGKARSQFLAMMSHEIRTPMNGVLGLVDVLKETSLDVKQKQLVGVIQNSGEMLLNIINDILDFSKADADSLRLESLPVDLEQVIDECVAVYAEMAKQKGILLVSHHDRCIPNIIECDPVRLKQVLNNLLSNAFKFTKSGHIFLSARIVDQLDGVRVRFEIEDTGIGLSMPQQEKLFTPFSQANRSIAREYGGTGLGLAISKKIVGLLGGDIGVNSQQGLGATFWFDIPIDRDDVITLVPTEHQNIIVCSDYDPLIEICRRVLSNEDVTVNQVFLPLSVNEGVALPSGNDIVLLYISGLAGSLQDLLPSVQALSVNSEKNYYFKMGVLNGERHLVDEKNDIVDAPIELHKIVVERYQIDKDKADKTFEELLPARVKGLKVLIAEDNAINQMVIRGIISSMVSEVKMVNNGLEAVEIISKDSGYFDLVLMDCEMPIMDGFEAVKSIRQSENTYNLPPLKIVALTAHALAEYREKAFDSGMDDHLTKPVSRRYMQDFFRKHYG